MKNKMIFWLALALGLVLSSCPSTGESRNDSAGDGSSTEISARAAIGKLEETDPGPLFEGDGGKDLRIAVLDPETQGPVEEYLPKYVQGLLNNHFQKYSDITLIDRQNLNRIIEEQNLAANSRYSDRDHVSIGNLTNAQYQVIGVIQKLSGNQYSLQLSVTESSTGERRADFMKTGTLAQMIGTGALINEAAADLLTQLGVRLTPSGRQSLLAGSTAAVQAETVLAKGMIAQASGSTVEALLNYSQAASFDPSQMEALTQLNRLSESVSGGTLTERLQNDLQAHDQWLATFKETARFFKEHPPFEITFDPNLVEAGEADYKKNTVDLGMRIILEPSKASFTAINALAKGLEQTGRRRVWGFQGWPLQELDPKVPETLLFEGKQKMSFTVDLVLLNENQKKIGTSSVTLSSGTIQFTGGENAVTVPEGAVELARFYKVKVEDLTPVLTVAITGVNKISSQELNARSYMRISPGDVEGKERKPETFVRIPEGTFMKTVYVPETYSLIQREVKVGSSFYIANYPVTQKEWTAVMGTNPSKWKGENLPVEKVSWYDAIDYCNKRSLQEGLTPVYTKSKAMEGDSVVRWNQNANGYRLPTEAEWEYACRAGTTTPHYSGDSIDNAGWHKKNSGKRTHPVGEKQPNPWGLYDMLGNVREWCWDYWYGPYSTEAQTAPAGTSRAPGSARVIRGGGWNDGEWHSSYSGQQIPTKKSSNLGFRVVRNKADE